MNESDERDRLDGDEPDDDELDEQALEQATGGTGHELAHTVQQGSGVGANETITVGGNRTISVGTAQKK